MVSIATNSVANTTTPALSVCKKTSLSRKRWMLDEQFLWNRTSKPKSAFQNTSLETAYSAPYSGYSTMTYFPVCKKTLLSRKWCMIDGQFPWNTNRKSWSPFQNLFLKTAYSVAGGHSTNAPWRQFQFLRKHLYLGNGACCSWNFCCSDLWKCCLLSIFVIGNCVQRPLAKISRRRRTG